MGHLRRAAGLLIPLLLPLLPSNAAGLERGELQLGGGPMLARALPQGADPIGGPGALGHVAFGWSGEWSLDLTVGAAMHDDTDPGKEFSLLHQSLTVRYQLDISSWEPYLLAGAGLYQGSPPAGVAAGSLGLEVGLGLALPRGARSWTPAAELRYHTFAGELDTYPHYFTISVRLEGMMRLWPRS